ncbi:MAG: CRISPR-associated helicase Cas3' [Eubacterium sp.]|jgi:CRISPR-associated endonuclease/helicase Cas3|nr:CRISPR-associated helicase Cas3' [Eubacterium sp.]
MKTDFVSIKEPALARITDDGRRQTLEMHLSKVSKYAYEFGSKCGIGELMRIAGLLHDIGKSTAEWQEYLQKSPKKTIPHSIYGARYAFEETLEFQPASEILGNIILAHHGSLHDNISPEGKTPINEKLSAVNNDFDFLDNLESTQIDLNTIKNEIVQVLNKARGADKPFFASMLIKLAYSCLVDSDRLDAYLFESDMNYLPAIPDWQEFITRLEKRVSELSAKNKNSQMTELRVKVSDDCRKAGLRNTGIYKLEVPTGGGKTLSSLRFALEHAKKHKLDRIIYVIPYLSILSQTAKEIRSALDADDNLVIEHHSNFFPDNEQNYKLHTDRWGATIILTTQVQFLESVFSAKGSDLRKLHNMAKSVIIFDEAQSIPIKCIHLFNSTLNFLNSACGSTILLCTATQPPFESAERKIIFSENPSLTEYIEPPKRYTIINELTMSGWTYRELAEFIVDKHRNSTLVIVNTKKAAKSLCEELKFMGTPVLHLSTGMCSAHRDDVINTVREKLNSNEPIICVSTQLIEAGVDISFECVVKDIAGLDSIYQAAGRCNRHGEFGGPQNVYVVNINDENLSRLPDIKIGAEITQRLFMDGNTEDIAKYYRHYFFERKDEMDFNITGGSIYDLLSYNLRGTKNLDNIGNQASIELRPAIRSAADEFYVIEKGQTDVIVEYKESVRLLDEFKNTDNLHKKREVLKKLGKYSVSLYKRDYEEMRNNGRIDYTNYCGLEILTPSCYNVAFGFDINGKLGNECV